MRKTDGSRVSKSSGNVNTFKLLWLFIGLFTVLVTFTGCTEYLLNCQCSDNSKIIAHKTWCGDCRLLAGTADSGDISYTGLNCIYPSSSGCCGSTMETCYLGCANGNGTHAIVIGDTSSAGLVAGVFEGCACIACGNDESYTSFGYVLPYAYEAETLINDLETATEIGEALEGCI